MLWKPPSLENSYYETKNTNIALFQGISEWLVSYCKLTTCIIGWTILFYFPKGSSVHLSKWTTFCVTGSSEWVFFQSTLPRTDKAISCLIIGTTRGFACAVLEWLVLDAIWYVHSHRHSEVKTPAEQPLCVAGGFKMPYATSKSSSPRHCVYQNILGAMCVQWPHMSIWLVSQTMVIHRGGGEKWTLQ